MDNLIPPHGSKLVEPLADRDRAVELQEQSRDWPSIDLKPRQLCDLELLLNGGYSPLEGFMGAADHSAVCDESRLADGTFWPVPITLDVADDIADSLESGGMLALRDGEGVMLAGLTVDEIFEPDREAEIRAVFGSADRSRPEIAQYLHRSTRMAVSGRVEGLQLPIHYDYRELRLTPREIRTKFSRLGWRKVLAFQTHRTIHKAQQAMTVDAAREIGSNLLIHPVVGLGEAGDADHYTRIRCYQALMPHFPKFMARLNLLPLASRGGGVREAFLQAIVHKNYGCTHLMVDLNGTGSILETGGAPTFDREEVAEAFDEHGQELGVGWVSACEMIYLEDRKEFVALGAEPDDRRVMKIDPAEVRRRLDDGREIPEWYTFASVAEELHRRHPTRAEQGFTVFLTGLSGSGKSTIANVLRVKLLEIGGRGVSLLDGDLIRANLSSNLGFSKEHRDLNIRRIGFVASEITRAGGVAICAPIAPYDVVRREVREMVEPCGGFVLIHVSTPIEVCESRDRKGMYAKARAGIIKEFTGVSDPYQVPCDADVVVDTSDLTPSEAAREVLLHLERQGFISGSEGT